jgi:uncharacterized protein with PIN domain
MAAAGDDDPEPPVMARATVILHGDLNDFVPRESPGVEIDRRLDGRPSAKDLLESVGVPHPEIAAITVNGMPAGFNRHVGDGDRVEAWPADEAAMLGMVPVLPPEPEDTLEPRFIVDGHLGRLAAYLRMLGLDTWYRNDADDERLAAVAAAERRILLTRDRGLLKRSIVRRGTCIRSDRPFDQLVETTRRFGPVDRWQPFGRCIRCNALLVTVRRQEILDRLEPLTRIYYDDFRRCPGCDAVYWRGSHHERMGRLIMRVRADVLGGYGSAIRETGSRR